MMKWALDFTIIISLLTVAFSLTGCSSMLYQPSVSEFFDARGAKLPFEDVFFQNEEQVLLHGRYFKGTDSQKGKKPRARILFFHGNGENLTSHFASLLFLLEQGYDYFIFDYQGYGMSEGSPSPKGTVQDGKAALEWIRKKSPAAPLVIFGQSLGGAVALSTLLDSQERADIPLTVIDSSFLSYKQAARGVLRNHWFTWLLQPFTYLVLSDRYAPDDKVSQLKMEFLVIHGTQDRVIPYELGVELFEALDTKKEFWKLEGGKHTDGFWRKDGTRDRFIAFLNQRFARVED